MHSAKLGLWREVMEPGLLCLHQAFYALLTRDSEGRLRNREYCVSIRHSMPYCVSNVKLGNRQTSIIPINRNYLVLWSSLLLYSGFCKKKHTTVLGDGVVQFVKRRTQDPTPEVRTRSASGAQETCVILFPSQNVVLTRCQCAQPPCVHAGIRMITHAR